MSSICSVNSCTSPDVTSSNVSSNQINGSVNNENPTGRLRTTVPDVKKDNKYWERRRRNNEAARRSREKRRMNDMNMDTRIMELAQRNKILEQELLNIKMGSGAINSSSSSPQGDSSHKKTKLTPIVPATENSKNKVHTTLLNGMLFPIFTAIKPINSTVDISESAKTSVMPNLTSGCKISIQGDNSDFPSNHLLTLSNIPLLSNLIATSNYNEDMASKPTLLLPPFQIPVKTTDQTTESVSTINLNTDNNSENAKGSTQSSPKIIKTELQDILDLRMKHENVKCLFDGVDEFSSVFVPTIDKRHNTKNSSNLNCHNDDNQSVEEPINNSFLTGSFQTHYCKEQLLATAVSSPQTSDRHCINTTRRTSISTDHNDNHYRTHRNISLGVRSRLQIRETVANVVSQENVKLYDAIDSLSDEIKQLKSVLLSITATHTTTPSFKTPPTEHSGHSTVSHTENA